MNESNLLKIVPWEKISKTAASTIKRVENYDTYVFGHGKTATQVCDAWTELVPGVSEQGRIYASENTLTLMVQIWETHKRFGTFSRK